MRIESIEIVFTSLMVLAPLTIIVNLLLVEGHCGNRTIGKQLTRKSYHT